MINIEYKEKLKKRFFGLLCEYEKGREWKKFIDTIYIELMGFSEEEKNSAYDHLMHNLASLRYLNHEYFRNTVFDCMNLIDKL